MRAFVIVVMCLLAGTASAELHKSDNGNIQVELPSGGDWKVEKETVLGHELISTFSDKLEVGAIVFVLGGENDEDAGKFFEKNRDSLLEKATWSAAKPVTINGLKGREQMGTGSYDGDTFKVRAILLLPTSNTHGVIVYGFASPKASTAGSKAMTAIVESVRRQK